MADDGRSSDLDIIAPRISAHLCPSILFFCLSCLDIRTSFSKAELDPSGTASKLAYSSLAIATSTWLEARDTQ